MIGFNVLHSQPGHPGALTNQEVAELAGERPLGLAYEPRATQSLTLDRIPGTQDRHDAGVVVITLLFVLDRLASGVLEEMGVQIKDFVETRLLTLIRRKRASTTAIEGDYQFALLDGTFVSRQPVTRTQGSRRRSASSPEGLATAAELLAQALKKEAPSWDMTTKLHTWDAEERGGRVRTFSHVFPDEFGARGSAE